MKTAIDAAQWMLWITSISEARNPPLVNASTADSS